MGVEPKIGGKPPKWMVKIMENPMNKWMIWGFSHIFGNAHIVTFMALLSGKCQRSSRFFLDTANLPPPFVRVGIGCHSKQS